MEDILFLLAKNMARKSSLNSHLSKKSVPKVDRSSCLSSNAWIGKSPLDGDARVLYIHITCFIHWIQKIPSCCISSCLSCYGVDSLRYTCIYKPFSESDCCWSVNLFNSMPAAKWWISHSYKQQVGLFFQFVPIKSICVRMNVEIMKRINIQLNSIWLKFSSWCLYLLSLSCPSNIHLRRCRHRQSIHVRSGTCTWHVRFVPIKSISMFHRTNQNGINMRTCHARRHACAHASVRWKER